MPEITAAAVNALRKKTGVSMMDCKQALQASDGDIEGAVRWLREKGKQTLDKRADRATAFGRFGVYASFSPPVGAMVELKCESAPMTQNEEFIQLANDLAQQLATGPGAATPEALLAQPSPSKPGVTLGEQKDDLFNRTREVFNVGRMVRIDAPAAAYSHNAAAVSGVLVQVSGGTPEAAKDVCMHVAAMRPQGLRKEDLDPQLIEKEREILKAAALAEGKPANVVEKMVEGRLRNFYAETVLLEQPFVKEQKQSVGQYAAANKMEVQRFVHWELA